MFEVELKAIIQFENLFLIQLLKTMHEYVLGERGKEKTCYTIKESFFISYCDKF